MSSQIYNRNEFESSFKSLDRVLNTPHSNFIITKDLKLIDKRNFSWKILCLFKPFYQLFGKDIYSHVRANQVAQAIIKNCQYHRSLLNERPILVGKIEKQILQRLKDKTHGKYDDEIDKVIAELNSIIRKPDEHPREPENKPFLNPLITNEKFTLKKGSKIFWPIGRSLKTLEISETDLSILQKPLKCAFRDLVRNPDYELRFMKEGRCRRLRVIDLNVWEKGEENILLEAVIPFSLEIVRSPKKAITDIIILAKKVLEIGGQSKVRLCYSIFRGMTLVRKSCHSNTQQSILKYFQRYPTRGIVPVFHLRPRKNKKMQVFEPLLDHDLNKVENNLGDVAKMSIAEDLLYGICAVHRLNEAHRDLKPKNILVKKIEGVWRGFITDFGFADRKLVGGSLGFRSPEQIAVEEEIASLYPLPFPRFIIPPLLPLTTIKLKANHTFQSRVICGRWV